MKDQQIDEMDVKSLGEFIIKELVVISFKNKLLNYIEKNSINVQTEKELNDLNIKATSLLGKFQECHKAAFKLHLKNDESAKQLLDLCTVYINILYNSFLNPINYALNKKAMRDSKKSLQIGKISLWAAVGIAFLSFALTIYYGEISKPIEKREVIIQNSNPAIQTNDTIKVTEK